MIYYDIISYRSCGAPVRRGGGGCRVGIRRSAGVYHVLGARPRGAAVRGTVRFVQTDVTGSPD